MSGVISPPWSIFPAEQYLIVGRLLPLSTAQANMVAAQLERFFEPFTK